MRGTDEASGSLFSFVDLEDRIPARHPLRKIRQVVNDALASLDDEFQALYTDFGRPSIAPERLIRASLIQILFSIRCERQLMEKMQNNLGMLRIVFVPAVVQRLPRAGEGERGHQLQVESGDAQMIHQHPMIIASCLKTDPDRQAVFTQDRDEPHEVIRAVGDRQAPATRLARDGNQHLAPVFGNVPSRACKHTLPGSGCLPEHGHPKYDQPWP